MKRSSKNCKSCLLIVSKLAITWSSQTTSKFVSCQFWTSYKAFLSLKYLFHLFYYHWLIALIDKSTEEKLEVIIISHTCFRVNLHSIVASMSCSKQGRYLKLKQRVTFWKYTRSNIALTSSLYYIVGFLTPALLKM